MSEPLPADTGPGPSEYRSINLPPASHVDPPLKGRFLLKLGGWLGVIASSVSLLIFLLGCFGLDHLFAKLGLSSVFGLAVAPLLMAVPGLLLSIAGGARRNPSAIDPTVLAALFVNILGLSGALIEIVVWRQWGLFPIAGGGA
jgi:hypothetical protein